MSKFFSDISELLKLKYWSAQYVRGQAASLMLGLVGIYTDKDYKIIKRHVANKTKKNMLYSFSSKRDGAEVDTDIEGSGLAAWLDRLMEVE